MTIKHIFSDMDGTLLNSKGQISADNIKAIKESQIPFTLVSARAPIEMEATLNKLNLSNPQIAFNGGLVFQPTANGRKILAQHYMDYYTTQQLVSQISLYFPHVSLSYYDENKWYTENIDDGIKFEESITGLTPTVVTRKALYTDVQSKTFKIMLMTWEASEMEALKDFLESLHIAEISVQQSGATYLEITSADASKSTAVQQIIDSEKLTNKETLAFGDGQNDISMLQTVGTPVVMGNAHELVKPFGKHITKTNDEDGVAFGLKFFVA